MSQDESFSLVQAPATETTCRKNFLVIEDNPDDAAHISRAFGPLKNCCAFVCRNSSEAKAYLQGAGLYHDRFEYPDPNAIICDLRLGQESGVDFVAWLKAGPFKNLPVAILTGFDAPKELAVAKSLGAIACLQKPKSTEDLSRLLLNLTSQLWGETAPTLAARRT